MQTAHTLFTRCSQNPLLDIKYFPEIAQLYNPAPVRFGNEILLLVSVVTHDAPGIGRDVGQTRIARSSDGINFRLEKENFITVPDEYPYSLTKHFIDNRVSKIGDDYYIITPVMLEQFDSPVGMLGKTKDFKTYEPIEIITQPRNRGASLFPEKINGLYYKLDRPGAGDSSAGEIWLSSSPDLIHWGAFRPVLAPGYRFWNNEKIGPTPPIVTEQGFLVVIHGVFRSAGGCSYSIGAILLDREKPWKVIGKTNSYLLTPEASYEVSGNCPNTVFPCGAIADYEKDKLMLYYGAADCRVCLAEGSLSGTIKACIKGN